MAFFPRSTTGLTQTGGEQQIEQNDGNRNLCDDWNDKIDNWVQNEMTSGNKIDMRVQHEMMNDHKVENWV